jgi:hypothetical protein
VRLAHLVKLALAVWIARWAAMEVASRLGNRRRTPARTSDAVRVIEPVVPLRR